jgi:hypothetical protein
MEAVVTIDQVRTFDTAGGNVRYVIRDTDGNEYTTFRERIGAEAQRLEGKRVRIEYHENQRGRYTNVYLDKVEPARQEAAPDAADTDPEEAAWRTAVEAAPWLVGESEPREEVPPEELYEKLKPFKERVAEDIKGERVAEDIKGERVAEDVKDERVAEDIKGERVAEDIKDERVAGDIKDEQVTEDDERAP